MKKLVVLQHAASEPLGVWEEELNRWHAPHAVVRRWAGEPLPRPADTLAGIVLGGPMHVGEDLPMLREEREYLQALLAQETHVLGVCLGAQLLAAVLGARVADGPAPEIGYAHVTLTPTGAEDALLSGFPMELPVCQWHRQGCELPAGADLLARSQDYPVQAFRRGRAWGFQFHLEATPQMVERWAAEQPDVLAGVPGLSAEKLAEQAAAYGQVVMLYGRQVIRRFWDSIADF